MEVLKIIKLDYSISSPEARKELVEKILEENPNPSPAYIDTLSDYLVLCMEKQERKQRHLLTENRLTTITKHETSIEGLASQLENGEDGIYNLMNEDKNVIFQPKISITENDLNEIPALQQLKDTIKLWEQKLKTANGKEAYIIKKALIQMRRDQYTIKTSYKKPILFIKSINCKPTPLLDDSFSFDSKGYVIPKGVSLCNPDVCLAILCNYAKLKEGCYGDYMNDLWYLMEDFDTISAKALEPYPLYEEIVTAKIDGLQNIEIQTILQQKFGITHSLEYISSLWRNKIPSLIASAAEDDILDNYYLNIEKGTYKKCSRCGQIKLAHNKYFSKNKTSKDGFYSICKTCRNTKKK